MDLFAQLAEALRGRYDILAEIGSGGMARVFAAMDAKHARKVAIKVLRPEIAAATGTERFLAEIRLTARLHHPHILPLFDSGESQGILYYVTPFVDGETLRDKLNRDGQLGVDVAVAIAADISEALDYAHRNGVVHRDLKPENILLHEGRPIVADFGVALALENAAGAHLTQSGTYVGTPAYTSPEQISERKADARSDVYALGVLLYEMLAGEPPHTGSTPQIVFARVLGEKPTPIRTLRPSVPQSVDTATHRALAKLPADRFANAREFIKALSNNPNETWLRHIGG